MAIKLFTGVNDTRDKLSLGELQVARDRIYNTVRPTKIQMLTLKRPTNILTVTSLTH